MSEEDLAGLDEDDLLAEDREVEEREQCVQDTLELILDRVNAHLDAAELQSKVVSYAVREAVKDALAVIDMTFVERESFSTRSPATEPQSTIGSWFPDEEPIAGPIDTWARGTVKARRRQRNPDQDTLRSSVSVSAKLGATVGAPRPPAVRYGGASVMSKTVGARLSSTVGPQVAQQKSFILARELPKPKRKPRLTGEALEKEQRLRDEIESRRAVQQMQRLQLQKDQQELRQLDKLQKSMRGRDYGYDHNGELVVVQKLDPDRMPAFAVGMKTTVVERKETAEEASARKVRSLSARRLNEVDYLAPEQSAQPSAMESMKMAKGVTLHQGGGMKSGPPLTSARDNMSRREYMELIGANTSLTPSARSSANFGATPRRAAPGQTVRDPNLALLSAKDWGMNPPSAMKQVPYEPPIRANPKAKTPSTKRRTIV